MTLRTNVAGATNFALQEAISAYSDEAYTTAKKISGTGIVGGNPLINTSTETFVGQLRWFKPLNPTINVASLTDSTPGTTTSYSSDYLTYVKSVRTHGWGKVNLQSLVTQQDGLAKVGRDFAETRAQDEHNAILAVCKGVAMAEFLNGTATGSGVTGQGGQTFYNDPTDKSFGFYVDLQGSAPIATATAAYQGAQRAEGLINAIGMAWKDYDPEYAYLLASPAVIASFRSANLVDQDRITEGNMNFNTIFSGKFRLIPTRATQSLSSADKTKLNTGAGVDIHASSNYTTFIILPGAIAMEALNVDEPTEIKRDAAAYKGGGTTEMWQRWGYVAAPAGYDWNGPVDDFASDLSYTSVIEGGIKTTPKVITAVTTIANAAGIWTRKATSALSLGILPVLHG